MKKTMIVIVIVIFTMFTIIVAKEFDKLQNTTLSIGLKIKLFSNGSEKQIREYLESPNSTVGMNIYYTLIEEERHDILKMLFKDYKLDPNYFAQYKGDAPLLYAAAELNRSAVEILLKYGADVNYSNQYGDTALILASQINWIIAPHEKFVSRDIVKLLVKSGADINAINDSEWTAIEGAIDSDDIKKLDFLVDNGGDIHHLDSNGSSYLYYCNTLKCIEYLLKHGLDINQVNRKGNSLLHSSVLIPSNNTDMVKKLIEKGADLCHRDNDGNNILRYVEEGDLNPHLHKDNPDFYSKKLVEHRKTKVYEYLKKEYDKECRNQ